MGRARDNRFADNVARVRASFGAHIFFHAGAAIQEVVAPCIVVYTWVINDDLPIGAYHFFDDLLILRQAVATSGWLSALKEDVP